MDKRRICFFVCLFCCQNGCNFKLRFSVMYPSQKRSLPCPVFKNKLYIFCSLGTREMLKLNIDSYFLNLQKRDMIFCCAQVQIRPKITHQKQDLHQKSCFCCKHPLVQMYFILICPLILTFSDRMYHQSAVKMTECLK